MLADELKKGTTPMLILSLLEAEQRHGYELSKLLEQKTRGVGASTPRRCTRCSTGSRSRA